MIKHLLIDFTSDPLPPLILIHKRIAYRGLVVSRFSAQPNPGMSIGAPYLSLAVHESASVEIGWRPLATQQTERLIVRADQFHIFPPDQFVHMDWAGNHRIFAVTFTPGFIEQAVAEAFDGRIPQLQPMAAIDNPAVLGLVNCLRRRMAEDSRINPLYLNHIGAMLVLKLYELYGNENRPSVVAAGGLSSSRHRRIMDYIEAHLGEDLNLTALAAETGLSRYHFSKAFRVSVGMPPYLYLSKRRILRAKELLLDPGQSLTEIGLSLGFSSHSHFTNTFRKIAGVTPSRFRKDRL